MIRFVFERLKNFKGAIFIVAFCAVIISLTDLMIPFLTAKFIDEILVSENREEFFYFIVLMFAIMFAAIASHYASAILSKKILLTTANGLTEEILRHIHKLGGELILKSDMVYLAKRVDNDATDLMTFIVDSTIDCCFNFCMLLMANFLLFSIGIKWMLIFFIVAAIHFVAYKKLSRTLFDCSVAVRETGSKYFTSLTDNFVYAYSIKLHCLNEKFLADFKSMFGKYFLAAMREMRIKFWFASTELNSSDVFRILVFLLGGLDVLNGEMTIGNLVALIGYYTFAMQAVAYFMSFGQGWQNALAAYRRLIEIAGLPIDKDGELKLSGVNFIEVRGLNYSIDGRNILKNFSAKFKRGEIYCIVGKNGAGKTTLLNFLCGMMKTNGGQINYNGLPINLIDMQFVRENLISFVEQKEFLRNDDLSGGERRKKSIIEALSKNPDVLIMDEPDNNLDEEALNFLIATLLDGKNFRVTILVSHEEKILSIADEIINLSCD